MDKAAFEVVEQFLRHADHFGRVLHVACSWAMYMDLQLQDEKPASYIRRPPGACPSRDCLETLAQSRMSVNGAALQGTKASLLPRQFFLPRKNRHGNGQAGTQA